MSDKQRDYIRDSRPLEIRMLAHRCHLRYAGDNSGRGAAR